MIVCQLQRLTVTPSYDCIHGKAWLCGNLVTQMVATLTPGPGSPKSADAFVEGEHSGLPSAVFATHPGGRSIEDPCFDFDLPLPFPLPFPLGYLVGCSDASDVDLLLGRGVAGALGAGLACNDIRYGINSGEARSNLISLSKGVIDIPVSACNFPTRLLDALISICLSHSMICWRDTEANPAGWARSWDRNNRCCIHISISRKEQSLA